MDTALIIVLAVVALLVIAFIASRASRRATVKRREMAGNLRVESTEAETRARRAEAEAQRERELAESRASRADRIDPDTDGPRRRLWPFNRNGDDAEDRTEAEARS
jgi:hypothetical protein